MKSVIISEFKAKCIKMLKEVYATNQSLVVTIRGKPLVTIVPCHSQQDVPRLGVLEGQVTVHGDIVQADWSDDWEPEP